MKIVSEAQTPKFLALQKEEAGSSQRSPTFSTADTHPAFAQFWARHSTHHLPSHPVGLI